LATAWVPSITRTFTLNGELPAWLPLTLKLERKAMLQSLTKRMLKNELCY
jgi:hypothetical protein